jgi:hypothetical protein
MRLFRPLTRRQWAEREEQILLDSEQRHYTDDDYITDQFFGEPSDSLDGCEDYEEDE